MGEETGIKLNKQTVYEQSFHYESFILGQKGL